VVSSDKRSYCRLCTAFCAIDAQVEAGRVTSIHGVPEDPVSGGYTCLKGRQVPHQLHGPKRLRSSLKRRPDGSFEAIATEVALDEIAEKIAALIQEHGPRSIASFSGTAAFTNSGTLPVVRAFHEGIGSVSNFSTLTIDQPAKMVAAARHGIWGAGAHTFESADVVLALGVNPIVSGLTLPGGVPGTNSVKRLNDARKRGLKLICVDPRRSELAQRADIHLQVWPGEDATLLAGMLRVIFDAGLHDAEFCADHTTGLEALRAAVFDFTPDYVERRSRVPADQMVKAARLFAAGPRGITSSGTGADMSARPYLTNHLLYCMNTLCGRHNREGERISNPGVLSLPVPRPAQPIPEEMLPPLLSWRDGPKSRFRGLHGVFGEMPSTTLADEILTAGEGQIRALIAVGSNPLLAMPSPMDLHEAYDSLELKVSIDIRLSTTARRSDYVIAAKHPLEREDVTEFMDPFYEVPYACYTRAVVEPGPGAVEDWEVFVGLANRLGSEIELPGGALDTAHPPSKFALLKLIFPVTRIPLDRLRARQGGQVYDELDVVAGPPLLGAEAKLDFAPRGVPEELRELRSEAFGAAADGIYTCRLVSRRLPHVANSVGHDFPLSEQKGTTNPAYMNASHLGRLGLDSGDLVVIESAAGSIVAVAAATDEVQFGVISMSHCFGDSRLSREGVRSHGSNTGLLVSTDRSFDPITGMARQSAIPVRIRGLRRQPKSREVIPQERRSPSGTRLRSLPRAPSPPGRAGSP
jgi:anaerobic selenocysteine-containing dehydrogenase